MAMSRGNITQDWALMFAIDFRDGVLLSVNYLRASDNAPACLLLDLRPGFSLEECGLALSIDLASILLRCT